MELYAIRINGLDKPMGFVIQPLLCSWKVRGGSGRKQAWVKIQVALDETMEQVIYEKEGAGLRCVGEPLELTLAPYTRYYYQITVTSDSGETAAGTVSWFETGKLNEPWTGRWIGISQPDPFHPEFYREISLHKPVQAARLYICGLGLFEAYINGCKAGDDLLAPFINDYEAHVQYCTYDVTNILRDQQNTIQIFLGNGWYKGRFGLGGHENDGKTFALIAELRVTYSDGSVETIGTDERWQYRGSIFALTDIYDGEIQNYLLWEGQENNWQQAVLTEPPAPLTARYSPPLHEMEALPVREVICTPAGEIVLDMGQNFTGYLECTQVIPAGVTMSFEFGEILQNGNFYNDNYRSAKSMFTYVSDGQARIIRPWFTFFGFRYVKVTGPEQINPACFTGRAVYSQMDQTGFIHTGNEKINQLFSNTLWGLKSNFLDMPTDCPQRDERLGWTGDAQVFAPTAGYHMDTRAFYAKYLKDLRSDQARNGGKVAMYLPNHLLKHLASSVWGDVATFLPWMYYTYYGSKEMLAEHYSLMKDWVDYVYTEDKKRGRKNLYDFGYHFGDWLALDGATEQSVHGRTDTGYLSSVYYFASTSYVAKAAEILGLSEATEYAKRAEDIRSAILDMYVTKTGLLAVDTQTAYLIALRFGIYRDRQMVIDGLRKRIRNDCGRIKCGFVGATMMNTVLAENGMADLAYEFLFFEGFPGWIYAVNMGATTIWERWNSVLPDGSISGTGMNSLNHYSYGSVVEFLYRCSAGIRPMAPAFQKVQIAPIPELRLGYMKCSYDSAYGRYVSNWEILDDGRLQFHIEIPFGCEAEIRLPEQSPQTLSAGSYDFTIRTQKNYLTPYTADTPVERLMKDSNAMAVLQTWLPDLVSEASQADIEYTSKSLGELLAMPTQMLKPTEAYERAIQEICLLQTQKDNK